MLVEVPEAMTALRCGRTKFYTLVKAGDIEIVKLGSRSLVPVDSLRAFVARLREKVDAA